MDRVVDDNQAMRDAKDLLRKIVSRHELPTYRLSEAAGVSKSFLHHTLERGRPLRPAHLDMLIPVLNATEEEVETLAMLVLKANVGEICWRAIDKIRQSR